MAVSQVERTAEPIRDFFRQDLERARYHLDPNTVKTKILTCRDEIDKAIQTVVNRNNNSGIDFTNVKLTVS